MDDCMHEEMLEEMVHFVVSGNRRDCAEVMKRKGEFQGLLYSTNGHVNGTEH